MIDWGLEKINEVEALVIAFAALMAIVFILSIAWRTRSLVPIIVGAFTAGLVLFAVNNTDWFKTKIEQETSLAPVVTVVDTASPTVA